MSFEVMSLNTQDEPENIILQTMDYSRFKFDATNRPIDPNHLAGLIDAIQKENLLHLFPVIVNRKFVIVDGQHRVRAAQSLGVPVYYIISDRMTLEAARGINDNTRPWRPEDFLHFWCASGRRDYIALRAFYHKYPWLTLSEARNLATRGQRKGPDGKPLAIRHAYNQGLYIADNLSFAEKVAEMALSFKKWITFYNTLPFVRAMKYLATYQGYDHKRMMQKMDYQSVKLVRCGTAEQYVALLEEIYNYKTTQAHYFEFKKPRFTRWLDHGQ